jgi:hypothetical protein
VCLQRQIVLEGGEEKKERETGEENVTLKPHDE